MFVTLLTTLIQQLTAHEMRGRVLSLYNIAFSAMPIGFMVGGALAQAISNEFALIFGAIIGHPLSRFFSSEYPLYVLCKL